MSDPKDPLDGATPMADQDSLQDLANALNSFHANAEKDIQTGTLELYDKILEEESKLPDVNPRN